MPQNVGEEMKLLRRIIYKSKNQHRRAKYFHSMQMAKRSLSKLDLGLEECLKMIKTMLTDLKSARSPQQLKSVMARVNNELEGAVKLANVAEQARTRCAMAALHLSGLVSQGRFLPFAVVAVATMSTLENYARTAVTDILTQVDECSRVLLQTCRVVLIKDKNRGEIALEAVETVNHAIDLLDDSTITLYKSFFEAGPKTVEDLHEDDDVGETVGAVAHRAKVKVKSESTTVQKSDKRRNTAAGSQSVKKHKPA